MARVEQQIEIAVFMSPDEAKAFVTAFVTLIDRMSIGEIEEFGLSTEMADCVTELTSQICNVGQIEIDEGEL